MLVTSGIDGVYPPGLAVAKVVQVENKASTTFETVLCTPAAGIDHHRQLLILLVANDNLPRPDTEEVRAKKEKLNRKVTRDSAIEVLKDTAKDPIKDAAPASGAKPAEVVKLPGSEAAKALTKESNQEPAKVAP